MNPHRFYCSGQHPHPGQEEGASEPLNPVLFLLDLDASSEKTQYAQVGVARVAESHIYDDISSSKVSGLSETLDKESS